MSDDFKQAGRLVTITTTLGPDVLLLESLRAREAISEPFRLELSCISRRDDLKAPDLVGLPVTVTLDVGRGKLRFFNGLVRRLTGGMPGGRGHRQYTLDVAPWFWFLSHTSDHRIFEKMTVPDIAQKIFREMSFDAYDTRGLTRTYAKREYCVQYGESHFDFISRLFEEEGIFYYFVHENGRHVMVLGDQPSAYRRCDPARVLVSPNGNDAQSLSSWDHAYDFITGRTASRDFNFEAPRQEMEVSVPARVALPGGTRFERFEFPGGFQSKKDGEAIARLRMEEAETGHETARATGDCKFMFAGGTFTLDRHDSKAEVGRGWAITAVEHVAVNAAFHAGMQEQESYGNSILCIPDTVPFRPPRVRRKPVIDGVQTAFVIGPKGEEIHCDQYGRVKLLFHWDRRGKATEPNECWVRTAQSWASNNWGAMTLPRVGMEVVVSFVNGDPDRPLITGCVNNADSMPVHGLPGNKTVTSFKTRSTPKSKGFNELRFDDKAGSEQIFIHAERDHHVRIKREMREKVGANRHAMVGGERFEHVGKSAHSLIKGDRLDKVEGAVSLDVGQNVHEKVGMNFVHKSGLNLVLEAGVSISLKVGGNFIAINPAGVFIQGNLVFINSGGSAAGLSASPEAPHQALAPVDDKPGTLPEAPPARRLPEPPAYRTPLVKAQVDTLLRGSASAALGCEICANNAGAKPG